MNLEVHGQHLDLDAPEVRIDLDTRAERRLDTAAVVCGYVGFCTALGGITNEAPLLGALGLGILGLGLVAWVLRRNLSESYLLEVPARRLTLERTSFGSRSTRGTWSFDELAALSVRAIYHPGSSGGTSGRSTPPWTEYQPVVITAAGELVPLADPFRCNAEEANRVADALGERLALPVQPVGHGETVVLRLDPAAGSLDITTRRVSSLRDRDWGTTWAVFLGFATLVGIVAALG